MTTQQLEFRTIESPLLQLTEQLNIVTIINRDWQYQMPIKEINTNVYSYIVNKICRSLPAIYNNTIHIF